MTQGHGWGYQLPHLCGVLQRWDWALGVIVRRFEMPHGWVLSLKLVTSLSHVPGQALGLLEHLLLLLQQSKTPSHSESTYCRGKGAKLDNNAQINRSPL